MPDTHDFTLLAMAAVMISLGGLVAIFAIGVAGDVRQSRQRRARGQLQRSVIARRRAWNWLTRRPGHLRITDRSAGQD